VDASTRAVFLYAIPRKEAAETLRCLRQLIALFGYIAVLVTDKGPEFLGVFDAFCTEMGIDHRKTSAHRPQANGRAERDVQTFKKCLRCTLTAEGGEWDEFIEQIQLAYNCSRHAATGFAPYTLLYGCQVLMPVQARERFREPVLPLDGDPDPEELGLRLRERATFLAHVRPIALENWEAANIRNSLRYATLNSGSYLPTLKTGYKVGDLVYVRRRKLGATTLDVGVDPDVVLQVVVLRPSGVLRLQGLCGRCISVPREETAPCHRMDIAPRIDPTLRRITIDWVCELCEETDKKGAHMMLCTMCSSGWHVPCLRSAGMYVAAKPPPKHLGYFCTYCRELRRLPCDVDGDGVQTAASYKAGALFLLGGPAVGLTLSTEPPSLCCEAEWQLPRSAEHVALRLQSGMAGDWFPPHVTRLWGMVPHTAAAAALGAQFAPTPERDYVPLLRALRWDKVGRVLDPWAGEGTTLRALGAVTKVFLTDLVVRSPLHAVANALELSDLRRVWARLGSFDGVVSSPWFAFLDLALMSVWMFPLSFVAFHVPGHFVSDATPPRAAFLQRMLAEGRLVVLLNLSRGVYGGRCAWVVLFRSAATREELLQPEVPGSVSLSSLTWLGSQGRRSALRPSGAPPRVSFRVSWAADVEEVTGAGGRSLHRRARARWGLMEVVLGGR
jgi:hypothetical protein